MNFQELLRLYPAHHVVEINKELSISEHRFEKIRRILARLEIRTTLYGEKVKIYHEMAFNPKGEIIPRYFGPPIRKHSRNWLACYCIPVLLIYYQTELPTLQNSKISGFGWESIPFFDESNLVIPDHPKQAIEPSWQMDLGIPISVKENVENTSPKKDSWRNRDNTRKIPPTNSHWNKHWKSPRVRKTIQK